MSTTQKRQKTLLNAVCKNLTTNKTFQWQKRLAFVCSFFIILIMSCISSNAQKGTPIQVDFLKPCDTDDWKALKALYISTNGDNWKYRGGWDNIAEQEEPPSDCDLRNFYGVSANLSRVTSISLASNNLQGSLPDELDLLKYATIMSFRHNHLSGAIPGTLVGLENLNILFLRDNNLTGNIPDFQTLNVLEIAENKFTCLEIEKGLDLNEDVNTIYNPQNFAHEYKPFIADPNVATKMSVSFNFNPTIFGAAFFHTYQWLKNGTASYLSGYGQSASQSFIIEPKLAGVYTLQVNSACVDDLQLISDPIYVIYPGYDFEGQPVESNQIMVEFEDQDATAFYEDQILFPNAGLPIDRCNCNRELYLWQFPSTEQALAALTEINGRNQNDSSQEDDIDGGFNNNVNRVGNGEETSQLAYYLPAPSPGNYPNAVNVFILDTGVDDASSCIDNSYLYNEAPADICYGVTPASGYDYLSEEGIDINYQDDQGHGTFGYHTMSNGFLYANNINIVPLKIFNSEGEGNLFDLTCALYHAIDHGADLVNISAGYQGQLSKILEKAINTAREQEVFICTSAGNNGINIDTDPQYPASFAGLYNYTYNEEGEVMDSTRYSNVISVASQRGIRQFASNSNIGPKSVTLSCLGEDLAGIALDCNNVVASGTSFATFVVSRYLALEIAKNNNRTLEQIWDAFEASELSWDGTSSYNKKTITSKRVDLNLVKQQVLNTAKISSNSTVEAQVIQTSIMAATLKYKIPENGVMQINLYDATGRHIQQLFSEPIYQGNHQLRVSKKTLESGIYFVHIGYESDKGLKEHSILKLPVLK